METSLENAEARKRQLAEAETSYQDHLLKWASQEVAKQLVYGEKTVCGSPRDVQIVQVIRVQFTRGLGVVGDPIRVVTRLYQLDGTFISEFDHLLGTRGPGAKDSDEKPPDQEL